MACYICDVCRYKLSTKQWENKDFQRVSSLESSFTCSECSKLFSMAFEVTSRDETAHETGLKRKYFLRSHSHESATECPQKCYLTGNFDATEPKFTHVSEINSSADENQVLPSDENWDNSAPYIVQKKKGDEKTSSYGCKLSRSIKSSYKFKECDKKAHCENQHMNNIPQQPAKTSQLYTSPPTVKNVVPTKNNKQNNHNSLSYEISNDNIGYKSFLKQPQFKDHDKKTLKCNICHVTIKTKGYFKQHMRKHDETNPFICKVCKKSFSTRQNLIKHMTKHSNERPFTCNFCSSTFKLKINLNRHLITHSEERPYKCHICPSDFKLKDYLTIHLATHSQKRPYKCDICNSSYKRKTHLSQHMRTHSEERPYKCHICPSDFKFKGYLTLHLATHSQTRPYKCDICPSSFKRKTHLSKHMRTHS